MAFFSNSGSRADSGGYNLNEKAEDEGAYKSVRDGDVDLNSRQWNLNEKAEDAYHSGDEQHEAGHSGLYPSGNTSGQHARRGGVTSGGPWGTNFLKDSRSKQMAKEVPLNEDRRMEDVSGASSHDDMDGSGEDDEMNRGNGEVPAEEMLSDDYYEQDGEEQSELLHRCGMKRTSCSTSAAAAKSASRQKKTTKYSTYADDDDDDDEYNDENDDDDDADEDDPDDVDFEPDSDTDKAAVKVIY